MKTKTIEKIFTKLNEKEMGDLMEFFQTHSMLQIKEIYKTQHQLKQLMDEVKKKQQKEVIA